MTFTIARLLWRQKDNILKRYQHLVTIPKLDKRASGKIAIRPIPDVGGLVNHPNPGKADQTLLMLSENPYHWRFESHNTG